MKSLAYKNLDSGRETLPHIRIPEMQPENKEISPREI